MILEFEHIKAQTIINIVEAEDNIDRKAAEFILKKGWYSN